MQNQISILRRLAKTLQKEINKLHKDKTDMIFRRTTKGDWNLFERDLHYEIFYKKGNERQGKMRS